jgi:hypothetical protein
MVGENNHDIHLLNVGKETADIVFCIHGSDEIYYAYIPAAWQQNRFLGLLLFSLK